jgi:hypothetical protein
MFAFLRQNLLDNAYPGSPTTRSAASRDGNSTNGTVMTSARHSGNDPRLSLRLGMYRSGE